MSGARREIGKVFAQGVGFVAFLTRDGVLRRMRKGQRVRWEEKSFGSRA